MFITTSMRALSVDKQNLALSIERILLAVERLAGATVTRKRAA